MSEFTYNKIGEDWGVTQKGLDGIIATRVCTCAKEDAAREIARRLTLHDELVAALRFADDVMGNATFYVKGAQGKDLNYCIDKIRALLKKCEVEDEKAI